MKKYKLEELRADVFNLPNAIQLNARNTTATFNNPTSMTLANNQYNADGSVNSARILPKNGGFGAATAAAAMRNIQLQLRFQF